MDRYFIILFSMESDISINAVFVDSDWPFPL